MKIFHSLRWRLQLWHGLILALVLAGFGLTAWQLQRQAQLGRIDRELEQRMGLIEESFRPHAGPDGPPPATMPRWSQREQDLFGGMPGQAFYFAVWPGGGRQVEFHPSAPPGLPRPERAPGPPAFRTRGVFRECFHDTPPGDCVLVGRNIADDLAGFHRTAWVLAGCGGMVFLLGLAGGWWITGRALRPISEISAAAAKISDGDLSQRIRPTDSGSELGQLARDLNNTFARLQAAFERQAQFTADASHELRTPVAVILTQAQSALARERPAAEYRESLAACGRAAERMRGLIDSLLQLARSDSGDPPEPPAQCDLAQIAAESAALLGPLSEEKMIPVSVSAAPAACMGRPALLAQAIGNIIANAIQHNRPGGSVAVTVRKDAGAAVVVVEDSGPGIPPGDLPHIFERFYRADKSRAAGREHSGLGLAIAKAIIENHGGSIEVASKLGSGTTFSVRVPAG